MAFGDKARNPETPYHVYALEWRGKLFYIGICQVDSIRHSDRWNFVRNLVAHVRAGTLQPAKAKDLSRKSNAVVAALIRAGLEAITYRILWVGKGRSDAKMAEAELIAEHDRQGHVLANQDGLTRQHSVEEVLLALGAHAAAAHAPGGGA